MRPHHYDRRPLLWIFIPDQRRVVERGTHAQLLRKDGLYAEMWTRQQAEREQEEAQAAE